jgi:molecular chaperone DnaJ
MKDYYKILNIKSTSTISEIKKSYRDLAQRFHPDKNNGKETKMFYEINEAYEVLSNSSKKILYDIEFNKKRINLDQILKSFSFKNKKENVKKVDVNIELKEGRQNKKIKVTKKNKCVACKGYGGEYVGTCISCNGSGKSITYSDKNILNSEKLSCLNCSGKGYQTSGICRSCNGKMYELVTEEYSVEIKISKR